MPRFLTQDDTQKNLTQLTKDNVTSQLTTSPIVDDFIAWTTCLIKEKYLSIHVCIHIYIWYSIIYFSMFLDGFRDWRGSFLPSLQPDIGASERRTTMPWSRSCRKRGVAYDLKWRSRLRGSGWRATQIAWSQLKHIRLDTETIWKKKQVQRTCWNGWSWTFKCCFPCKKLGSVGNSWNRTRTIVPR